MLTFLKNILPAAPQPVLPFEMRVRLAYEITGETELVFNFQPAITAHQRLLHEDLAIHGARRWECSTEAQSSNRVIRMRAGRGTLNIDYRGQIEIAPEFVARASVGRGGESVASPQAMPYLLPSRYCESDKLLSFAYAKFSSIRHPYARAHAIRDWVEANLSFTPGVTDWHTSAVETFAERRGVCRDFAHLMIALCRATNLPARFVTGFDYGCTFGETDFHAYVEVLIDGRWFLFDATGLCPRPGLVRIATGRDAADTAFATIFGPATMKQMKLAIHPAGTSEEQVRALDRARYAISTARAEAPAGVAASGKHAAPSHLAAQVMAAPLAA
jgi:transglutaminase-like putative cysteine protease